MIFQKQIMRFQKSPNTQWKLRYLTLRELEMLQGFSDMKWPANISRTQEGSMVGNAMSVPVLMAAMAAALRSAGLMK